jgi:hypothetical protein
MNAAGEEICIFSCVSHIVTKITGLDDTRENKTLIIFLAIKVAWIASFLSCLASRYLAAFP